MFKVKSLVDRAQLERDKVYDVLDVKRCDNREVQFLVYTDGQFLFRNANNFSLVEEVTAAAPAIITKERSTYAKVNFSDRLRELRVARTISQKEMSALLGVSENTVLRWEDNSSSPNNISMEKINKVLKVKFCRDNLGYVYEGKG